MNTLKIGFLVGSLKGTGSPKTILALINTLTSLGHSIDLFISKPGQDYETPPDIRLYKLPNNEDLAKKTLEEHTSEVHYDLFITKARQFYDSIKTPNKYCSVHTTPTAWIRPSRVKFWRKKKKTFKLMNEFQNKRLIALSNGIKEDLCKNLRCRDSDITVIPNAFETNHIKTKSECDNDIPSFRYIVYVASLIPRKRHIDLLHALSIIDDKDIQLVLVGEGKTKKNIIETAKLLDIGHRLHFTGWQENPYKYIKNAEISVLCSEAEGLPRVLIESLLLNTKVVSTDCPSGPKEVMLGDLGEFLVPVGNRIAMATAIEKALRAYPDIPEKLLTRFNSYAVAEAYLRLADNANTYQPH